MNAVVGADAPAEVVEKLKKDYGFDKPLPVQYAIWLGRALTGDLGLSVVNNQPVSGALAVAVPNTLMLAITATLIGFILGALLGGLAGYFQGTWVDKFATGFGVAGVSIPHYWLGIVLVIIFAVELNVLAGNRHRSGRLGRLGLGLGAHPSHHSAGHHAVGHSLRDHHAHGARSGRRSSEPGIR